VRYLQLERKVEALNDKLVKVQQREDSVAERTVQASICTVVDGMTRWLRRQSFGWRLSLTCVRSMVDS